MSRLLFIDTETGGVDPNKHSLLSIGLVVWDSYDGLIYEKEYYVKQREYVITQTARQINKISLEDLRKATSTKRIIEDFHKIKIQYFGEYQGIPLAGHNTQFDVQFIKKMFLDSHRSFGKVFSHRILDTYSILRYLYDSGRIDDKIESSAKAFSFFGINVEGRHTALGDAKATMQLYEKMLKM
ncbi:MAG: 3'-5' exonuclease [Blautia wexlerae]